MNQHKLAQMVRELPFLAKILKKQHLSANSIGNINVEECVDRNLLDIKPKSWSHDDGGCGEHSGHRIFWCVAPREIILLDSIWSRIVPYERNDYRDTSPIGSQLLSLNRNVQFLVEIHEEGWNFGFELGKRTTDIVIYKMRGFNWRSYCPAYTG